MPPTNHKIKSWTHHKRFFVHDVSNYFVKAKGVCIGRPQLTKEDIPPIFYRHYPSYINGKLNVSELARVCDMSRTTVYRYINILKA